MNISDDELARIEAKCLDWMRAGREVYKREAMGDKPTRPSDIIIAAEGKP